MAKLIKVTLLHSPINRKRAQRATLKGLGLTKLHKSVFLENNAANRGMVRKVVHLVDVAVVSEGEKASSLESRRRPSYRVVEAK